MSKPIPIRSSADGGKLLTRRSNSPPGEEVNSDDDAKDIVSRLKQWLTLKEKKQQADDEESLIESQEEVAEEEEGPAEKDPDYVADDDEDEDQEEDAQLEDEAEEEDDDEDEEDVDVDEQDEEEEGSSQNKDPLEWANKFQENKKNERVFRRMFTAFVRNLAANQQWEFKNGEAFGLDFLGEKVRVAEALRSEDRYQEFKDIIAGCCRPDI
jgi:hypothetical protein